jgi:hypothetical protein
MIKQSFFSPGQHIVLRQMSFGKIWQARPAIVVRDTPELMAFFVPPGSIWKDAAEAIRPAERVHRTWSHIDSVWGFGGILRLSVPGAHYSVVLLRNTDGTLYRWYINLEDPLCRTRLGFDYEDRILDIVIKPDLSNWSWMDEDELEEVVSAGLVSKEKVADMYAEGEIVVKRILSGRSPFNGWEKWRPGPSWKVPVLPEEWNKI